MKVTVLDIHGANVKLGFEVDPDIPVHRAEVWERINAGRQTGSLTDGTAAAIYVPLIAKQNGIAVAGTDLADHENAVIAAAQVKDEPIGAALAGASG